MSLSRLSLIAGLLLAGPGVLLAQVAAPPDVHYVRSDEWLVLKRVYRPGRGWERAHLARMVTPASTATRGEAEFFVLGGSRKGERFWTPFFTRTRAVRPEELRLGTIYYALDHANLEHGVHGGPLSREEALGFEWFAGTLNDDSEAYKGWVQLAGYRVRPTALRVPVAAGEIPVGAGADSEAGPEPSEGAVVRPDLPPIAPVDLDAAQRQALRSLLKRLRGIADAHLLGRPPVQRDRQRLAQEEGRRLLPVLDKVLSAEERRVLEQLLKDLGASRGATGALVSLDACAVLAGKLPSEAERAQRAADRAALATWICAEAGDWRSMPNLGAAFAPVLLQAETAKPALMPFLKEHVAKAKEAQRLRDKAALQRQCALLRRLLEELEP